MWAHFSRAGEESLKLLEGALLGEEDEGAALLEDGGRIVRMPGLERAEPIHLIHQGLRAGEGPRSTRRGRHGGSCGG